MLLLGKEMKALGLAELLTSVEKKAEIFTCIASYLATQSEREREVSYLFSRAEQVIATISDDWGKAGAQVELARALTQAQRWEKAEQVIVVLPEDKSKAKYRVSQGTSEFDKAKGKGEAGSRR